MVRHTWPKSGALLIFLVLNMQAEIQRQAEIIRTMDDPPEPPFSGSRPYFANLSLDNAPVSPRQLPQDDPRRGPQSGASRNNFHRPPVRLIYLLLPEDTDRLEVAPDSLRQAHSDLKFLHHLLHLILFRLSPRLPQIFLDAIHLPTFAMYRAGRTTPRLSPPVSPRQFTLPHQREDH